MSDGPSRIPQGATRRSRFTRSTQGVEPTHRWRTSKGFRLFGVIFLFFWVIVLLGFGAAFYLRFNDGNQSAWGPGTTTVAFTTFVSHGTVHITIQTVGAIGYGDHPDWVSYLVKTPRNGKYENVTEWQIPPYTKVVLTNHEYDGVTALRNPAFSQVSTCLKTSHLKVNGVVVCKKQGSTEIVNGHPMHNILDKASPGSNASLRASFDVAHTFTVPALGVNVPWYGVTTTKRPTLCPKAPCTAKYPHVVDKVTFTSGPPGQDRWQCFIPCGVGYLDGNGGPMQSIGYMGGFLKVVAHGHETIHVT